MVSPYESITSLFYVLTLDMIVVFFGTVGELPLERLLEIYDLQRQSRTPESDKEELTEG